MNRRDRKRRRTRRKSKHPFLRVLLVFVAVCIVAAAAAGGAAAAWVAHVAGSAPSITSLHPRILGQVSEIYAADGTLIGHMDTDDINEQLSQSQQPALLRRATVAIEDRRFFHHGGVDYVGLLRAAVKDAFQGGGDIQGGSTLTMQLVKNVYMSPQVTHNLRYKVVQAELATQLESHRSKDWILTQYLNDVPYGTVGGRSAYGVGAASQMFFDKSVRELDLAQIALLAGLPQAPTTYNPFANPSAARQRRSEVLEAMREAGYITRGQERAANASGLQVKANNSYASIAHPYLFDYVEKQLVGLLGQQVVDRGGLKVYTSINMQDQGYANAALAENEGESDDPAAAVATVDPANGEILALAQNTKYGTGSGETMFDYATDAQRQPGSSFKTFVLMAMIHDYDGDPDDTYYDSSPLAAGWLPAYPTYSVHNAEAGSMGVINVTKATTESVNAVYAQLGVDVGMDKVDAMAHAMGITAKLTGNPAEAIGGLTNGPSPLQMADAYATLANGGDHIKASIVTRVKLPTGKTLTENTTHPKRVLTAAEAYEGTQVLKTVVTSGTGTPANYGCPAAGKTGTTSNYTDAWFVGYTPQLSTAVWVGYPNEATPMYDVNGLGPGYGGTLAAPIWRDYMEKASAGYCSDFTAPTVRWVGKPFAGAHTTVAPVITSTTPTKTKTGTSTTSSQTGTSTAVTHTNPTGGAAPTSTLSATTPTDGVPTHTTGVTTHSAHVSRRTHGSSGPIRADSHASAGLGPEPLDWGTDG
jgi:penicillin-binding protein 1A